MGVLCGWRPLSPHLRPSRTPNKRGVGLDASRGQLLRRVAGCRDYPAVVQAAANIAMFILINVNKFFSQSSKVLMCCALRIHS